MFNTSLKSDKYYSDKLDPTLQDEIRGTVTSVKWKEITEQRIIWKYEINEENTLLDEFARAAAGAVSEDWEAELLSPFLFWIAAI
jgi:hypothetical protein